MDKFDYIQGIIMYLNGTTGINYQLNLKHIFKAYYSYLGKTYEMPDYYGGDQKNDGWVIEDAVFYQVFAPTRLKEALKKEIQKKFEDDIRGLLKIVYNEGKWNGQVKEFIFIVNTFDGNLPNDSERFFDTLTQDLMKEYNISFKYRVENSDYVNEILIKIDDIEVLKQISASLHIRGMIDYNAITETMITKLIIDISGNLNEKLMGKIPDTSYKRISSTKKISINNLDGKREEIEKIISNLDVVEKAINGINQDILYENRFERVKEFIVGKYEELSCELNGIGLYEALINDTISYSNNPNMSKLPTEFLVVYIFDKCDIFEKE